MGPTRVVLQLQKQKVLDEAVDNHLTFKKK